MRRLLCVLIGLIAGCSGGGGTTVTPVNRAPTITFGFAKLGVLRNSPTTLSVSVNDPDGDPTTVSWSVTRGTPQSGTGTVLQWTAPGTPGTDTVVVSVTDGNFTRKITEEIKVCYFVNDNTVTFLKSRSPYIVGVTDPATNVFPVDATYTTTIEAGVELLIDIEGTVIAVSGRLVSLGTDAEPVVIRPNLRDLQCGDRRGWWLGIRGFTSAGPPSDGEIELDHTEVWYADNGVRLGDGATAKLHDCAIVCSGANGVLHAGFAKLELLGTEISNGAGNGVAIGSNVSTAVPDSIRIERCVIKFNGASGLVVSINDPDEASPITVEYNEFRTNFVRAVTLARASFPAMHFNFFTGNGVGTGVSNIYLESGYPNGASVPTLNATCNYFGVTNQTSIDATIRDSLDSGLVGTRVVTDPWLSANPLTTPPNCTP